MKIEILENEYWYGTCVKYGVKMPLSKESVETIDLRVNQTPNQCMPLLLSTRGRLIYREEGFKIEFNKGYIDVPDDCKFEDTKKTLKEVYLYAANKYFPSKKVLPAKEFFEKIIYNSWIELMFYQNQKDILNYARNILKSGMPNGVLMIDDGWSEYYGDWTFHSGKFPNAKEMIKELKDLGFNIMVWICPFVTADSIKFREAKDKGILLQDANGKIEIIKWWNGYSAVLDMRNENARDWLYEQLDKLVELGVDGFKFDAGDSNFYKEDGNLQSNLWAKFGEKYRFNEYRVAYNAGGYGLLQRLCDKTHTWDETGVASLIPDTLLQGITGHPYGSPDMIGGGEYINFINVETSKLDQELFVRHAEIACLLPAMQFSAAPYRVLNTDNFNSILKSLKVREKYLSYLLELVENARISLDPIIRYMSYEFPNEGVEKIIDQFMLGEKYLVAPVYEKDKKGRYVYLPKGEWVYLGEKLQSEGSSVYFESEKGVPLIFERIK